MNWGRTAHLGERVDDYVDGLLSAKEGRAAALHITSCSACAREVEFERMRRARVRAVSVDPGRHASLVAGLLAMAPKECELAARAQMPAPDTRPQAAPSLISPEAPAQYERRGRRPVAVSLALVASGAAVAVVASASPHAAAPSGPGLSHQRTVTPSKPTQSDTTRRVTAHSHIGIRPISVKSTSSGTMALMTWYSVRGRR